jgi:hypothetical protein
MEAEGVITDSYMRGIFFNYNHQIQYGNYQSIEVAGKVQL